jgi:hypothetical protein
MKLFSDDALQFENLATCGIHRDASLRILQSACRDCESLYNILKSIDCNNKGHDANELIDGNTKVDAKADKKVYAKVDAKVDTKADAKVDAKVDTTQPNIQVQDATFGITGNLAEDFNGQLAGNRTSWLKKEADGKCQVDTLLFPNKENGSERDPPAFLNRILEIKFKCGESGPVNAMSIPVPQSNGDGAIRVKFSCMTTSNDSPPSEENVKVAEEPAPLSLQLMLSQLFN